MIIIVTQISMVIGSHSNPAHNSYTFFKSFNAHITSVLIQFAVTTLLMISIYIQGWKKVDLDVKEQVQERFLCCGFQDRSVPLNGTADYPSCDLVDVSCFYLIILAGLCKCCVNYTSFLVLFKLSDELMMLVYNVLRLNWASFFT